MPQKHAFKDYYRLTGYHAWGPTTKANLPTGRDKAPSTFQAMVRICGITEQAYIAIKWLQRLMKWPDKAKFWRALSAEQRSLDLKP